MSTSSSSTPPLVPEAAPVPDTLQQGELFLTIPQFQQFLALCHQNVNRRSIYRWLNLSKQYLPASVQELLKPAPMLWFLQIAPVSITGRRPINIVIPLRYFTEELRPQAMPLALHHIGQHPQLTTLETLKALNGQLLAFTQHVQQKIKELEHTIRATHLGVH